MTSFRIILTLAILSVLAFSCSRDKHYRIGVSQCSDDDWRMLLNEEINQEIMFYPEAKVEIRTANDDSQQQIEDIRYFMENDFDIIIAAPNEAKNLTPIINEAYGKGIPVLLFDRRINGDSFTAYQGADNKEIGRQAAKYAQSLFPNGGKVMELKGLAGSTPALGRAEGFEEYLDSVGNNMQIVASGVADWKYDRSLKVADSLLAIHPDVDVIYAHNDRMALGAADAAARRNLHPKIIGVDAAPHVGMQAVADGKIDATFLYPTDGEKLIETAMAILKGEKFDRIHLIPVTSAVDKSNVDVLLQQSVQVNEETMRLRELKGQVDNYWSQHSSQTALLYAAIAILVLVCIVLFLVLRAFWQHRQHRAELLDKNRMLQQQHDLEKDLNKQLAAATQSKLTFFTNVSHDLRTPLTLISEPVAQLSRASNLTDSQNVLARIADKNVKILLRLINQILDFRKYENDKLVLNLEEGCPAVFAKDWTEVFRPFANKRHIKFNVELDVPEGFTMAFDVEKVERVVFNLLFNAFKFTPVKGEVSFIMRLKEECLEICVNDNGCGISAENQKNIFNRFYQVDKIRPDGSGIGLSLAKAFVELHHGTIAVDSKENEGASFCVCLPVRHVEKGVSDETIARSDESAKMVADIMNADDSSMEVPEENDGKPVVLVIDDNEDVRILIGELLKDEYNVIGASSGKEGIRIAARHVPDVIICDVMMPGMDGLETCSALKEEISTSHIPVLMLTACSLDEQKVEGYKSGADGYMSKPFNSEVLRARVSSLINNRRRVKELKEGDRNMAAVTVSSRDSLKDRENEFYTRFVNIVHEEMGSLELSVDLLAEKMGMGRSQFYRKIKALTGLSPVEILRDLRLKRARDLLISTDKTVSEIGYEVGFSTPAYFTKCFREVYSETPTAFREKMRI